MSSYILLDANLAVLFAVGMTRRDFIEKHKRLGAYDATDYDILLDLITHSRGIIFTPNVLSETSNLVRQASEPVRSRVAQVLAAIIDRADERVVFSRSAVRHPEYVKLGLTDAVLLELSTGGATLLTVDLDLYLAAIRIGLDAINFNHIRESRPDFR